MYIRQNDKVDYYSTIKRNEIPFAAIWMGLEGIMFSEIRQINMVYFQLIVE